MKLNTLTDVGVKRSENQDNYWGAILSVDGEEAGILCLCDGMGGLNNGGLASKIVVESVRDSIKMGIDFLELSEVISQANKTIYELALQEKQRMGTTCTVLLCYKGKYQIYHVGDSRCYLLKGNSFNSLTTDHSALNKYKIVREEDEKLWRRYKNSLTRCIGVKPTVQLDYYQGDYEQGDVFLTCSDGMWHYFEGKTLFKFSELFDLDGLIRNCIEEGETDNITGGILCV